MQFQLFRKSSIPVPASALRTERQRFHRPNQRIQSDPNQVILEQKKQDAGLRETVRMRNARGKNLHFPAVHRHFDFASLCTDVAPTGLCWRDQGQGNRLWERRERDFAQGTKSMAASATEVAGTPLVLHSTTTPDPASGQKLMAEETPVRLPP